MKINTFTFRESFDRAPYRKNACVFESRFRKRSGRAPDHQAVRLDHLAVGHLDVPRGLVRVRLVREAVRELHQKARQNR